METEKVMIEKPTVLVLGAGASIPYDFPSGQGLKDQICKELVLEKGILWATLVRQGNIASFDKTFIEQFGHDLMRSPSYSVDAFLEHREDYLDIGKKAIADVLLRREKTNNLFDKFIVNRLNHRNFEKDWYQYFYNHYLDVPFEEFSRHSLAIITFNYDRSFKQYLFECLKNKHNKSNAECAEQVLNIPILHVYGKLGALPWEQSESTAIPYDSYTTVILDWKQKVNQAAENIKIIHHDDVKVSEEFEHAHILLNEAERIYFLGFGFHETNVKRLMPEELMKKCVSKCRGTTFGLGPHEIKKLKDIGLVNINAVHGSGNRDDGKERAYPDVTIYEFLHSSREAIIS